MPPSKKPARKGGTNITRRNRPGWKPERGQRIMGIPEPVGFAIVMGFVILLILWAFGLI